MNDNESTRTLKRWHDLFVSGKKILQTLNSDVSAILLCLDSITEIVISYYKFFVKTCTAGFATFSRLIIYKRTLFGTSKQYAIRRKKLILIDTYKRHKHTVDSIYYYAI